MGILHHRNAGRAVASRGLPEDERRRCYQEIERLTHENGRLRDELARARTRQEDLVNSAEIWIRLYEAHLSRSRQAGIPCSALQPSRS